MRAMHSRSLAGRVVRGFGLGLVLIVASLGSACTDDESEPPGLGYADAASEDLLKAGAPVVDHDLSATAARGRQLSTMERILDMAFTRGLPRVGNANAVILVPMATVDDGGRSGEVVFYRWLEKDLARDGTFDPVKSRRWLVVPFLLLPDRVLELEQFDDIVEFGGAPHRRLAAMKQALELAQEEYPGGDWRVHSMRQQIKEGMVRSDITRVFLMAVAPNAHPDLEAIIMDGRGKKPGEVRAFVKHHDPGAVTHKPLRTVQNRPGVPTVARALEGAEIGDRIEVHAADGSVWRIDGELGTIERRGGGEVEGEGEGEAGEEGAREGAGAEAEPPVADGAQ
jgi:hypothetical protein